MLIHEEGPVGAEHVYEPEALILPVEGDSLLPQPLRQAQVVYGEGHAGNVPLLGIGLVEVIGGEPEGRLQHPRQISIEGYPL